jgi:hypothetical protein
MLYAVVLWRGAVYISLTTRGVIPLNAYMLSSAPV